MMQNWSSWALVGIAVFCGSCAKPEEKPRRENELEQRIAKLEAALAERGDGRGAKATGPREAGGAARAGTQGEAGGDGQGAGVNGGSTTGVSDGEGSLEQRIDALEKQVARTMKTSRVALELNKTGNEVCAEAGKTCLTVLDDAGSARYDVNDQFCGHMVADCNARVTKRPHCAGSNDYALAPVKFYRSPGNKAQCDFFETETCESSPGDLKAICLD